MTNPHTRLLCRWQRLIFGLDWMWWCAWWLFFERDHVDCGCPWSSCLPNVFGAIQTMAAFFAWTNMIHSIVSIMFINNWQNDPNSSPQWQLASSLVHSRGVAARTERAAPAYYSLAFLDPDWDPGFWILDLGSWILGWNFQSRIWGSEKVELLPCFPDQVQNCHICELNYW